MQFRFSTRCCCCYSNLIASVFRVWRKHSVVKCGAKWQNTVTQILDSKCSDTNGVVCGWAQQESFPELILESASRAITYVCLFVHQTLLSHYRFQTKCVCVELWNPRLGFNDVCLAVIMQGRLVRSLFTFVLCTQNKDQVDLSRQCHTIAVCDSQSLIFRCHLGRNQELPCTTSNYTTRHER